MSLETLAVQDFANAHMSVAQAGFAGENGAPAMATPMAATPQIVIYVVQGTTICLVC